MQNLIRKMSDSIVTAALVLSCFPISAAWCSDEGSAYMPSYGEKQSAFNSAWGMMADTISQVVSVASKLFPLGLIIIIIAIIFTRDQKQLSKLLQTAVYMAIAYVILLILGSGMVQTTIQDLVFNVSYHYSGYD